MKHDNDRLSAKNYAESRQHQRRHQNERSGLSAAGFAYGRRNAILDLMRMRFGGPCHTDDAELFAEVLVPFIVEAAVLHKNRDGSPRSAHTAAYECLNNALPLWTAANGDQLSTMVAVNVERRAEAVRMRAPWLPTMSELVAALRPTREEARHLRGWGCIDPATRDERLGSVDI